MESKETYYGWNFLKGDQKAQYPLTRNELKFS